MAESIGEKLRLAREARGIALRDISEQTRISIRYLEAIEADDYRRLPGGIFNRSFIRAYAKFIGYDENNALEDYARSLRERGESDDEGSKSHHSLVYTDDGNARRSSLRTLFLAILILAALSAAVYFGLRFYQRSQHSPRCIHHSKIGYDPDGESENKGGAARCFCLEGLSKKMLRCFAVCAKSACLRSGLIKLPA